MRFSRNIHDIRKAYNLDWTTLFIYVFISFSFLGTYKLMIPFVLGGVFYEFYKAYTFKISLNYLLEKLFYLLIFSLVFFRSIHSILLITTIVISLINQKSLMKGWRRVSVKFEMYILFLFLIILLNLSFYGQQFKGIETFLYLLLYPILFISLKKSSYLLSITKIIRVYLTSVIISIIYLSIMNLLYTDKILVINTYFSDYLDVTHVYYGMFIGFSICLLFFIAIKNEVYISRKLDGLLIFILIFFLIYIGARMSLLAVFFVAMLFMYSKINFIWYKKIIIIFFLFSTIGLLSFKFIPRVRAATHSISELYTSIIINDKHSLIFDSWRNVNQRYLVWTYSVKEIKENFIFGIGIKKIKQVISDKIIKDGYVYFTPINTHNQYLQFLLGLGVLGFFYFIFIMFMYLIKVPNGAYFLLFFLIIMLTESILVRVKGISLFFIFYFILSYNEGNEFNNGINVKPQRQYRPKRY